MYHSWIKASKGKEGILQKWVIYLRQQLNSIVYHTIVQNAVIKGNIKKTGHALVLAGDLVVSVVLRVAPVADNVHSTDHLTNGKESDNLRESNTGQGEFLRAGIADTGGDVSGRDEVGVLKGGRAAESVDQRLVEGLEGSQVGRSHVLSTENELGEFKADLSVVEGRGYHRIDESDDFSGPSTNLPQSTADALGGIRKSGTSGGCDTRETSRCLGGSRGCSLASLLSRLRGGGGVSDSGPPGQELRLPKNGTGRGSGHLEDHRKEKRL